MKIVLEQLGIDQERVALEWVSAAEAPLFVKKITSFTDRIRSLGHLGEKEGLDPVRLQRKIAAARVALEGMKMRSAFARQAKKVKETKPQTENMIDKAETDGEMVNGWATSGTEAVKEPEKKPEIKTIEEHNDTSSLPDKKLLRVYEVAQYFGVHERTIRLWIDHGKLIAEKPAGIIFISRESIQKFRLSGLLH